MISRLWKRQLRIDDWTNPENPQWRWQLHIRNGYVVCEKWDNIESRVKQDNHWLEEDNTYHPLASKSYPALPGAELRLFESLSSAYYSPLQVEVLRELGASKLYEGIPALMEKLEIYKDLGRSVVHADVYYSSDFSSFHKLERRKDQPKYGKYTLHVPENANVLVERYVNTTSGKNSISVYYRDVVSLQKSLKAAKDLIKTI